MAGTHAPRLSCWELQACLMDYGNKAGEKSFAKAHTIEYTLEDAWDSGSLSLTECGNTAVEVMFTCVVGTLREAK